MGDQPPRDDDSLTTDPLTDTTRIPLTGLIRRATEGRPRVVVVEGGSLGQQVEISSERPLTIGREPDNSLSLQAVGVSRRHAVIQLTRDGAVLRDLGSKNGTYIDKKPIREHQLRDGDLIFIGSATLKYLAAENVERLYYDFLYEVSARDGLTGLANRRAFDEHIAREMLTCATRKQALVLLMIDVDHVLANQHAVGALVLILGNQILQRVAKACPITHSIRLLALSTQL